MAKKIAQPKNKAPKYKVGDMVYSWQNPDKKMRVSHVREEHEYGYPHQYKIALSDEEGYSYSSKWMSESSLSKTKKAKGDY